MSQDHISAILALIVIPACWALIWAFCVAIEKWNPAHD